MQLDIPYDHLDNICSNKRINWIALLLVQVLQESAAYYSHNLILHVRECGVSCTVETRASASIIPAKSPKELRSSGILEKYVNVFVMFKMFLSGNFNIFFSHIIRICSNLGMSDTATLSKAECMYETDPRKIISRMWRQLYCRNSSQRFHHSSKIAQRTS